MNSEVVWRNVYIHVPFCGSKCGYCAFYSLAPGDAGLRRAYLDELEKRLRRTKFTEPVSTVYIGGGTPDFLSEAELRRLAELVGEYIPRRSDCEVSVELNPEYLTAGKMTVLNALCTRLSVGVQSFDAEVRRKLMRRCRADQLDRALELLRARGCKHFNMDLIYGVNSVSWPTFAADLERALAAGTDHLSCYALTPEENSRLGLADCPTASDAEASEWWEKIGAVLNARGIRRYEVSNYARENAECRHNCNVWRGETLLGLGPSASGFDGVDRYTEAADLERWLAGAPPAVDRIAPEKRAAEVFAVNLRTVGGWTAAGWERFRPGTWAGWRACCERAAQRAPEWWKVDENQAALTDSGLLFWDEIAMDVLDWKVVNV